MNRYIKTVFLLTMILSVHFFAEELPLSQQSSNQKPTEFSNQVITIITDDEENPFGQYWPASTKIDLNGYPINNASIFIDDTSYSNIIESLDFIDIENHQYLGYFIKNNSEKIYLYGTEDILSDHEDFEEEEIELY